MTTQREGTRPAALFRSPSRNGHQRPAGAVPVEVAGALPQPPKPRRRWGLFAAMVALVCLGALGNLWLVQATSDTATVLAARSTIERGAVISGDDLVAVRVGADPSLQTVAADQLDDIVGKRAAVDVASGSLLTPGSVTSEVLPAEGFSLVGVSVTPDLMPGTALMAGDLVRVVATAGQQGAINPAKTEVEAVAGEVVSAVTGEDVTGQGASTVVTLQVPAEDATTLAAMAATGNAAVVLDSRAR